jgi:ElaB/YqjD/DUF883 family membrane-anchored ribosome-binding protein
MNKNGFTGSSASRGVDDKIDSLKDTVKGIVDQGAHTVDAIKDRVVDVKDQAFEQGNLVLDRVTALIKAHPLKAIGIAFGVGFIGMRLMRR